MKNNNGKGIGVDPADDIAAVADGSLDYADFVLSIIDIRSLTDGF